MAGTTLERFVTAILRGEWTRAGVAPPMLSRAQHRAIVAHAARTHDVPPFTAPWDALDAEEFTVVRVNGAPRCGFETDKRIIVPLVPYDWDRRVEGMLLMHARSHGWGRRLGERDANEADYWHITAEFVLPARYRASDDARILQPFAPEWFLDELTFAESVSKTVG